MENQKYCPNCGGKIPALSRFCPHCGWQQPVREAGSVRQAQGQNSLAPQSGPTPPVRQAPPPAPPIQQAPAPTPPPVQQTRRESVPVQPHRKEQTAPEPAKKTGKLLIPILILVGILLVVCLILLFRQPAGPDDEKSNQPTDTKATGTLSVSLHSGMSASGTAVDSDTVLFDDVDNWEPGAYTYENLTISNDGTLPMDYCLNMEYANATENSNGNTLTDVLKVGVIPGGLTSDDSEIIFSSKVWWQDMETFDLIGSLTAGETYTFAIVIYWSPTADDGQYQQEALSIELGISMTAQEKDPTVQEPVKLAEEYTREIVKGEDSFTYLTEHYVRRPVLTASSADAQAINEEIDSYYSKAIETLKNYEEEEYIYLHDYVYTDYNGVVGLALDMGIGLHYGACFSAYKEYFFDTNTGKRLTYQEYIQALGLTEDEIRNALEQSGYFHDLPEWNILWILADGDETYVLVESPWVLDDFFLYHLSFSLLTP